MFLQKSRLTIVKSVESRIVVCRLFEKGNALPLLPSLAGVRYIRHIAGQSQKTRTSLPDCSHSIQVRRLGNYFQTGFHYFIQG